MEIRVTDRPGIEAGTRLRGPYAVISIRSPGRPAPRIPPTPNCLGILSLAFSDAEYPEAPDPPEIHPFTQAHAEKIWEFVERLRDSVQGWVVHCEAGMNRSPAVAAALAEWFGQESTPYFRRYAPNLYVYRTLRRVLLGKSTQRRA